MNTEEKNRKLKTIGIVAKAFMSISKRIEEQTDTPKKFASVEQLIGLNEQVIEISPNGGLYWAEALAYHAVAVAKEMDTLDERDLSDDQTTFVAGLGLSDALDGMSRALLDATDTFRIAALPEAFQGDGEDLKLVTHELAFECYLASIGVQDAIGSQSELNPLVFPLGPWAVEVRHSAANCDVNGPTPLLRDDQPAAEYNIKNLKEQLTTLGGLTELIAAFFKKFAALLLALLDGGTFFKCARQCGTPTVAHGTVLTGPTIAAVRSPLIASCTYQPEMDVTWSVCCHNWCWFDKDHLSKNVSTTVMLGRPWKRPVGRPVGVAITVAKQRSGRFPLGTLTAPAPTC